MSVSSVADASLKASRARRTIALCFLAATVEGIDLQSGGVAGPGIAREFAFNPSQMGFILSASYFGLICGASLGGRLADLNGRKPVLIASIVTFGLFALSSTIAVDFPTLLAARLLTGLGLGGALANLVALTAEAAGPGFRNKAVAMMYCGLPAGSIIVSGTAAGIETSQWRMLFYVAGFVPLFAAPLLALMLRESQLFLDKKAARMAAIGQRSEPIRPESAAKALFGEGRALTTILLWLAIYFPPVALNLLLNWLPSLLNAKGLDHTQAGLVQVALNMGSAIGILTYGIIMDGRARRSGAVVAFAGIIVAMLMLGQSDGFMTAALGAMVCGIFLSAANLIVLSSSASCYGTLIRGTGVGAAVAMSRLGSATGALAPGQLLALGLMPNTVLLLGLPGVVLAGLATLALFTRPQVQD